MNQRGVWNDAQHAQEIADILSGKYRQFTLLQVPTDGPNGKIITGQGFANSQGMIEMEGNALWAIPYFAIPDLGAIFSGSMAGNSQVTGNLWTQAAAGAQVYVRFNHVENPWLPIGLPSGGGSVPNAYCLTIARMWFFLGNQGPAGSKLLLILSKGVSVYGGVAAPGVFNGYQAPQYNQF